MADQKEKGNIFDKIFKENVESLFLPLIVRKLGIDIQSYKPLKDKMQTTLEREMDFFYEVLSMGGKRFILHMEFQTTIDQEMIYRFSEYHGIGLRKWKLPMRQVLVYIGEEDADFKQELLEEEVFTGFELIDVHRFDTSELLSSQVPEVVLLAVLSNYAKEQTENVLRLLLQQLKRVSKSSGAFKRYLNQLLILSRLRRAEDITLKITNTMPITIDIENDSLYLQGIEKGMEKGMEKGIEKGIERGRQEERTKEKKLFVENLLRNTDFDNQKIASLAGVSLAYVGKVKKELSL
jgi:predicted transposase YdaD